MSNLTYDNAYNRRIAEICQDRQNAGDHSQPVHFTNMLGGVKPRQHILSGSTPYDQVYGGKKSTLAKTMRDLGRVFKPLNKNLKPVKHALMERAVHDLGKPMYTQQEYRGEPVYAEEVPMIEYDNGLPPLPGKGKCKKCKGGVNRLKKAEKWSQFARDLIPKQVRKTATNKAVEMIEGGVNRIHKAEKWSQFARDLIPKQVRKKATDKAVEMIEGMGKPLARFARGAIVSKIMKEKGMKLGEASKYVKEHNLWSK